MPFRDFDEEIDQKELAKEGPVFRLGGEDFHCLPVPPGAATLNLVAAVGKDERGRHVYHLPDIDAFVRAVLIETRTVTGDGDVVVQEPADDVARWDALMNDKKRPIPIATLGQTFLWLQAEYTTRPTGAPAL